MIQGLVFFFLSTYQPSELKEIIHQCIISKITKLKEHFQTLNTHQIIPLPKEAQYYYLLKKYFKITY